MADLEESKDLDTMKVEELVGSLQTYELFLPQPKKKNLPLKTSKKKVIVSSDEEIGNLALLANKFRKFFIFKKWNNGNTSLDLTERSKGNSSGSSQ